LSHPSRYWTRLSRCRTYTGGGQRISNRKKSSYLLWHLPGMPENL